MSKLESLKERYNGLVQQIETRKKHVEDTCSGQDSSAGRDIFSKAAQKYYPCLSEADPEAIKKAMLEENERLMYGLAEQVLQLFYVTHRLLAVKGALEQIIFKQQFDAENPHATKDYIPQVTGTTKRFCEFEEMMNAAVLHMGQRGLAVGMNEATEDHVYCQNIEQNFLDFDLPHASNVALQVDVCHRIADNYSKLAAMRIEGADAEIGFCYLGEKAGFNTLSAIAGARYCEITANLLNADADICSMNEAFEEIRALSRPATPSHSARYN